MTSSLRNKKANPRIPLLFKGDTLRLPLLFKEGLGVVLILLLTACRGGQTTSVQAVGDTIAFKYATQLTVVRYDGYTVVTLKNPWKDGKTLHQYVLVPAANSPLEQCSLATNGTQELSTLHSQLPNATFIRTPLRRSMIFSTVHCAMLMDLGKQDCIAGVADLKYIKIPWIQQQVKEGRISDVGDGLSPVVEKIIDQRPDALFLSPFENSGGYGKLEDIDIPIVECAEYMESSPLGRAEWLRFYGMLFGCEQKADSLFDAIDKNYNDLKALAAHHPSPNIQHPSPTVLLDNVTGSVWYVPGGKSTIGQMIQDAGGSYPWAGDTHSGSVSLPFESVLEKAGEADVWLFRYSSDHDITYDELRSEHHGYNQFKAFREKNVYGCNVELSPFYEETPFRPDWLLNDFIRILHPELDSLPPLRYYKKL
jgi:iron complex transport system substrate-binding protein